jgi:hypothetical protein
MAEAGSDILDAKGMSRISGLVLARESGSGVPNLVVAAYDAIDKGPNEGKKYSAAQLFAEAGRPIASVLTDNSGRFQFPPRDFKFQGNELRPNVIIAVFAPEDVDPQQPVPKPAMERILYISTSPRQNVGAEEAYVIRLSESHLKKLRIPFGWHSHGDIAGYSRLSDAVEHAWESRAQLKASMQQHFSREYVKTQEYKKIVVENVITLSAVPAHIRDKNYLIDDKSMLRELLPTLQARVMEDGLNKLNTVKPKLRLHLSKDQLNELGTKNNKGELTGEIPLAQLAATMRAFIGGVDLIRPSAVSSISVDELERRYISNGDPLIPQPKRA